MVSMKKARTSEPHGDDPEEMLPEYAFDYRKARPNRFAIFEDGSLIVVLDPDIARVFTTPESVKKALRALIETMPQTSGD
jgi:hypothetical protein